MLRFQSWLLSLVLLACIYSESVRADCYSRDRVAALDSAVYRGPELLSCGKGTNNCCLVNEKCGTNLLCYGSGYARQYCADPGWEGCSQLSPETVDHGLSITFCGNNIYCYKPLDTCCLDSSSTRYFIDPMTGDVKDESEANSTASPTWWKVDSASILASSVFSSQATANPIPITSTPTSAITATSTPTSPPVTSQDPSPPSHGLSTGASIGIGVGCGVVGVGAGILVWLFLRERRKRRVLEGHVDQGGNVPPRYQAEDVGARDRKSVV